jgi:uncharacterized protein (DUF169 family)
MNQATQLTQLLGLKRQTIGIAFQESAPPGIDRINESAVSGCTYWKLASEGRTFYTEASDHFGCPVGAHTHGIDLPGEKAKELEGLIGTMVQLQYIDMKEVPGIPRVDSPFGVAVYAPLADAPFTPDAVIVSGNARQMMLLAEAAHAAGVASDSSMVGRPTCAAIPAVMRSGGTATNLGCIGNRVYTGLADDELYFVLAGSQLDAVVGKLATIVNANNELEKFHQGRVV